MGLWSQKQLEQINATAVKVEKMETVKVVKSDSITRELDEMSRAVLEYFKDSPAILITSKAQLHDYVSKMIDAGIGGIDTETTGLDRLLDHVVGASLYYPGGVECYIPNKHILPVFNSPYPDQLSYEDVAAEFQRFVEAKTKLIFANADFDLAMTYHSYGIDLSPAFYYDVQLAWRCIKEDEKDNALKVLYNKYVLKGVGDPKKFSDFFTPSLFPYSKPEVAKLYAAHDAKITYELYMWQLPWVTKGHPKCKKAGLEKIADLIWNLEFPIVPAIQALHRRGVFIDQEVAARLVKKYDGIYQQELAKLRKLVQEVLDNPKYAPPVGAKRPFLTANEFNPGSPVQVSYLLYTCMKQEGKGTDKAVLGAMHLPVADQILQIRHLLVLINTFVQKLPKLAKSSGNMIHGTFKQIGADTGRMCIAKGTKISILNGYKNIEDIEPGDYVYCYDDAGNLQLAPVVNKWLTGVGRDCVKVKWQSTGKHDIGELICTPEHPIRLKDGTFVRADSLKRYDKVVHMRRSVGSAPEWRPILYGWNGLSIAEQHVVRYSIFGKDDSWVVHHKNRDCTNNELSNLEPMLRHDHYVHHGIEGQQLGVLSSSPLHTPEAKAKARQNQNTIYVDHIQSIKSELLDMIAQAEGRLTRIPRDFDTFKKQCEIAGVDYRAECQKYNKRYYKSRIPQHCFQVIYNQFNGLAFKVTDFFGISYDKFYKYCREYGISRNHMIQSVKPCGSYDVYDIEVQGYHNFIANEICVHNSSAEPNLQNIPSHVTDIRHMFRARPGYATQYEVTDATDESFVEVKPGDAVRTPKGYKPAKDIQVGDSLIFITDTRMEDVVNVKEISSGDNGRIRYVVI